MKHKSKSKGRVPLAWKCENNHCRGLSVLSVLSPNLTNSNNSSKNASSKGGPRGSRKQATKKVSSRSQSHDNLQSLRTTNNEQQDNQSLSLLESPQTFAEHGLRVFKEPCLSDDQLTMCLQEVASFFDAAIRTIDARLHLRERFDVGFDVIRERGHRRFELIVPAFETERFAFLRDPVRAPWMDAVRECLGGDADQIHSGCFLSLPGAAGQNYHQDGPHLNYRKHLPCHAVNLFIPLVDMTMDRGPTEFCLASHVLGKSSYNKQAVVTPLPKRGVPIAFDYRLGHRGLANKSNENRPVLFFTYAKKLPNGKVFSDKVNFSKRRYPKLGPLVAAPVPRAERLANRNGRKENSYC